MAEPLLIFQVIKKDNDKQELLQKILAANENIYLQCSADQEVPLKPISVNSNKQIKCQIPENSSLEIQQNELACIKLAMNNEKYMIETQVSLNKNHLTLTVVNIFHLQRRRNFRYVLPENYTAQFNVSTLNDNNCSYNCRLLDLSTEGCAVEISHETANINLNDRLSAVINFENKAPIYVSGEIKNIRVKDNTFLVLGIEFNYLATGSEEFIVSSIAELQREIYFRKAV